MPGSGNKIYDLTAGAIKASLNPLLSLGRITFTFASSYELSGHIIDDLTSGRIAPVIVHRRLHRASGYGRADGPVGARVSDGLAVFPQGFRVGGRGAPQSSVLLTGGPRAQRSWLASRTLRRFV